MYACLSMPRAVGLALKQQNEIIYWAANPFCGRPCRVVMLPLPTTAQHELLSQRAGQLADFLRERYAIETGFEPVDLCSRPPALWDFVAAVCLKLLNHVRGELDHAGALVTEDRVSIFVEFHHPDVTRSALDLVMRALTRGDFVENPGFVAALENFWNLTHRAHPDFAAHALIAAAKRRGLHYARLEGKVWVYGAGRHARRFVETSTLEDVASAEKWSKLRCKALFDSVGAPTAAHRAVESLPELLAAATEIGFPCVVKPNDAAAGRGVTAGIADASELEFAFHEAQRHSRGSSKILVERFVSGRDFRLLVIRGKFVGCASSVAPSIVGDGIATVRALIARVNATRSRNLYASGYLRPIVVDASVSEKLRLEGLALDSVPAVGRRVVLRRNTNLGGGGTSDLFPDVHPRVIEWAETLARATGLHSVGLDYITTEISEDPVVSGGCFTEVNRYPGTPLFLAAGMAPAELGARILGDDLTNCSITVYVMRRPDIAALLPRVAVEQGAIYPTHTITNGQIAPLKISPDSSPERRMAELLLGTGLDHLHLFVPYAVAIASGIPAAYASRVVVGPGCDDPRIAATLANLDCVVEGCSSVDDLAAGWT